MSLRVYVGFDERLPQDFEVAAKSARRFGCTVIKLRESLLRMQGILTRPLDYRGGMFDLNSNAPQSTEFAIARFAVPLLAHSGWALFVDSDVVFLEDPHELLPLCDESKAVMVVQHAPIQVASAVKMDGQVQTIYKRKLWSSVCLWNADHPANRRLNLTTLNQWPGRELHAFGWLDDDEIGMLPPEANWLVGVQPKPRRPMVAHYTLGTPALPEYANCEHAEFWLKEASAR